MAISSTAGGCYIGGVVALLASSPIAASKALGWEYIFWIFGAVGALWLIPWSLLSWSFYSSTTNNINSSNISNSVNCWKVFLTTRRVWVLLFTNFCCAWGFWVFMSWMPTFYKAKFGTDLQDLGYFSIIPYLLQGIISILAGILGDWVLRKQWMSLRSLRVVSQTVAMWGAGVFLLLSVVAASNIYIGATHFTLSLGFLSLSTIGANIGHLDLAPDHAGSLFGLLNSASVLSGVLGVPLSGLVLDLTGNSWVAVFALTCGVYMVGSIVWIFMADLTPLQFNQDLHNKEEK